MCWTRLIRLIMEAWVLCHLSPPLPLRTVSWKYFPRNQMLPLIRKIYSPQNISALEYVVEGPIGGGRNMVTNLAVRWQGSIKSYYLLQIPGDLSRVWSSLIVVFTTPWLWCTGWTRQWKLKCPVTVLIVGIAKCQWTTAIVCSLCKMQILPCHVICYYCRCKNFLGGFKFRGYTKPHKLKP